MENLSVKTNYFNMPMPQKLRLIEDLKKTKELVDLSSGLGEPTVSSKGVFPPGTPGALAEVDGDLHVFNGTGWVKHSSLLEEHLFERITKEIEADENIAVGFYLRHLSTQAETLKSSNRKKAAVLLEASREKIVAELNNLKAQLDSL